MLKSLKTGPAHPIIGQALWSVDKSEDPNVVRFTGVINERFEFGDLLLELSAPADSVVVLDCEEIRRINSEGVGRWARFIGALAERDVSVIYRRCSVPMVTQLSQIPALLRNARVESVFAPYVCKETDDEGLRLLVVEELGKDPQPPTFTDEQGTWEFDDLPGHFFAFLRQIPPQ